jgi:peroxidase
MLALLLAAAAASCARAQLNEKFYSESCPSVEDVVRKEMVKALSAAPSLAGPLLRMHFHDCFVRVSCIARFRGPIGSTMSVQWPDRRE